MMSPRLVPGLLILIACLTPSVRCDQRMPTSEQPTAAKAAVRLVPGVASPLASAASWLATSPFGVAAPIQGRLRRPGDAQPSARSTWVPPHCPTTTTSRSRGHPSRSALGHSSPSDVDESDPSTLVPVRDPSSEGVSRAAHGGPDRLSGPQVRPGRPGLASASRRGGDTGLIALASAFRGCDVAHTRTR